MVNKNLIFAFPLLIFTALATMNTVAAASTTNESAAQAKVDYLFLNPDNTINICQVNHKKPKNCRHKKLPSMVGNVIKIEQLAPLAGTDSSWINFSTENKISICAEQDKTDVIICSRLKSTFLVQPKFEPTSDATTKGNDDAGSANFPPHAQQANLAQEFSNVLSRIGSRLAGTQAVTNLGGGGYCDGGFEAQSEWDDCPPDSPYGGSGNTTGDGGYGSGGYGDGPFTPPRVDPVCAAAALRALNATVAICQRFLTGGALNDCINGANSAYLNDYINCIVN